ncbi:hypothetical protein [Pedobacter sp. L105]|uniref:hypothetical protein n=1 Tax=Pedobacter sp. L105 TaxID=1641871 RepID=UPI00131BEF54|nr:hypothetical protein [Pedobacter sp. L105]
MSFLNAVINNVEDETLREDLQDRVDIVLHKIKFMDKVPVCCLDTQNIPSSILDVLLETAGAEIQQDPLQAKVVLYQEPLFSMSDLMGYVPALMEKEWPAVEFNRVYLLSDDTSAFLSDPESFVASLEDIAEILYPGYFVFGNEGKTWMSFGV